MPPAGMPPAEYHLPGPELAKLSPAAICGRIPGDFPENGQEWERQQVPFLTAVCHTVPERVCQAQAVSIWVTAYG
jgi:hypothetical protein